MNVFKATSSILFVHQFQQNSNLEVQDLWNKITQHIRKFTTQQTGKILPASSENAYLHFCDEMATGYHIGRKQRRAPCFGYNRYNAKGRIHAYRQKGVG